MRPNYNIDITTIRTTNGGDQRIPLKAMDLGRMYALPVNADIQEGDHVEQKLPNGRLRTVYVERVEVLQSPFGNNNLDHTEAHYVENRAESPVMPPSHTFNISANNFQLSTGDYSVQNMKIGIENDELLSLVDGISALLISIGATTVDNPEFSEVKKGAIQYAENPTKDPSALVRFLNWAKTHAISGADKATAAVIGFAASGVADQVNNMFKAIGS